jgi:hypothetical protein
MSLLSEWLFGHYLLNTSSFPMVFKAIDLAIFIKHDELNQNILKEHF